MEREKPYTFCSRCGQRLIRTHEFGTGEFDTGTGKEFKGYVMQCPSRKWYNGHDKHVFSDKPSYD